MTTSRRNASGSGPVAPGKSGAAAAAAARSPATGKDPTPKKAAPSRSDVPPERHVAAGPPVANAALAPPLSPLAPPPAGEGGVARADDGSESENEAILSPESINASRWDADNARRKLRGQVEDGLEGYDKLGVSFKLYDICKHKHFLRISVLQVAELFLCAG